MSDLNATSPAGPYDGAPVDPMPDAAKPASWWEDYVDIFYAPSAVFTRRENSGFGVPMLLVTLAIGLLMIGLSGALQPAWDGDISRSIAQAVKKNPQTPPEALESMRKFGEIGIKVGTFIIFPVLIFISGLLLWIVGKFLDAKESLGQAVTIAAYSFVPAIVGTLLSGVQGLLMDPASLNGMSRLLIGPARFLDPDTASPMQLALLGRVELFSIWGTVLLAIGLSVMGKIPRSKAAIAAVIVWLIGVLAGVVPALRS